MQGQGVERAWRPAGGAVANPTDQIEHHTIRRYRTTPTGRSGLMAEGAGRAASIYSAILSLDRSLNHDADSDRNGRAAQGKSLPACGAGDFDRQGGLERYRH